MNVISRRHVLRVSGLAAGVLLPFSSRASITASKRARVNVNSLPVKPVIPSVDLLNAMNVQVMTILGQFSSGTQDYKTMSKSADLVRAFATQINHMEIDDQARSLATKLIGQEPPAPSSELLDSAQKMMSNHGISVDSSALVKVLQQDQQSHDTAHTLISRVGASGVYHSFADMLEAGASEMFRGSGNSASVPAQYYPKSQQSTHQMGVAHLMRVQNACQVPPPPPPPPWYCPSTPIIEAIGAAMTGVGGILTTLFGATLANLDSLALCSTVAAASLTGDAASEGAGLVATPFELWICENSQAITAGLQKALSSPPSQAGQATAGAVAGAYLYGQLKDFLKGHGCTV